MAGDVFQKVGDSVNRTITKISVKTSSSLEKSKIKLHIESLTSELQKMLQNVGEHVYNLWLNGENSDQQLEAKLNVIKQKKSEIAQLNAQLAAIDDRDDEILGNKSVFDAKVPAQPQKPHCPNCGTECEATAKFCRKCGYKLQ